MRLYLFVYGVIKGLDLPVPGYLIQTDAGQNVLVDTGFPANADPTDPLIANCEIGPDDYVVAQLARLGLAPADIHYLVATHLDPDHAGAHAAFPAAEIVVQRRHLDVARSGLPRFEQMRPHWDQPTLRYRLVDGDTTLVPGVELIEASGHVPGLQAVLVRLPETGPVLLAIDAIPIAAYADPDTRAIHEHDMDEATTRASTRKLVELARREGAMMIFGHDPDQWRTLKRAPAYYS